MSSWRYIIACNARNDNTSPVLLCRANSRDWFDGDPRPAQDERARILLLNALDTTSALAHFVNLFVATASNDNGYIVANGIDSRPGRNVGTCRRQRAGEMRSILTRGKSVHGKLRSSQNSGAKGAGLCVVRMRVLREPGACAVTPFRADRTSGASPGAAGARCAHRRHVDAIQVRRP